VNWRCESRRLRFFERMGCCSSSSTVNDPRRNPAKVDSANEAGDDAEADEEVSVEESVRTSKGLLHTNSMLFPVEEIEKAKKSVRLQKPVNHDGTASAPVDDDPDAVFMGPDPLYELGMEIEYAPEMKDSQKLTLMKRNESGEFVTNRSVLFGYKTIQGRTAMPPRKPNQDSVVAFRLEGRPDVAVFGVFDGHGPFGEHASHFCRMELHRTMVQVYKDLGNDASHEAVLTEAIRIMHETFIDTDPSHSGVDPMVSGTTLIVALVVGGEIIVANVGDSRCILGEMKNGEGRGRVVELSDDHKPERESERARILESEAILMTEGQLRGGSRKEGKTYICRKRNNDIVYGVLFTRSVGDLDAHEYLAVSAEPEFKTHAIDDSISQCLVLASDGVWDQMTNETVMSKIFKIKEPLLGAEQVADLAKELWDNDRMHSRRDDITILVVQLT